jgi:phage-related minor tail protein
MKEVRNKNMKIDSNFDEVARAEQEARENRIKLEETLRNFGDKVETKVEGVAGDVNERKDHLVHRISDKMTSFQKGLETGADRVDETIQLGRKELDTRLGKFDNAIGSMGSEFDLGFDRVKQTASRLRTGAHGILDDADKVGAKLEAVLVAVRRDLIGAANELLLQAERIAGKFRTSLSQGTGQVRQILDRAESSVNQAADPVRMVSSNPRVAMATLLFGGMVLGLFMKKGVSRVVDSRIADREVKPVDNTRYGNTRAA